MGKHFSHLSCAQTIIEGPYEGNYYSMGQHTGGCLYRCQLYLNFILKLLSIRERDNGKIIRACDDEPGTMYEYHQCYESGES